MWANVVQFATSVYSWMYVLLQKKKWRRTLNYVMGVALTFKICSRIPGAARNVSGYL